MGNDFPAGVEVDFRREQVVTDRALDQRDITQVFTVADSVCHVTEKQSVVRQSAT